MRASINLAPDLLMPEREPRPPARVLATFTDYSEMLLAMRARAHERQLAIGSEQVSAFCGLPANYVSKLLAPRPMRRIGMISLAPLLAVLQVKLQMIEDPDAMALAKKRIPKRSGKIIHDGAITQILSRRFMQKIGKNGAQVRWGKVRARRAAASKAALARWAKARSA